MSEREQAALEKIVSAFPKMSDYQMGKLEGYCERIEDEKRLQAAKEQPAETDKE